MIKSYLKSCFLIPPTVASCIIAPSDIFSKHRRVISGAWCLPSFPQAAVPARSYCTLFFMRFICFKSAFSVS